MKKDFRDILKISKYLKPYRVFIFISIVCSLFDVGLKILIPYVMQQLMDTAASKNFDKFLFAIYFSGALIAFAMLIAYLGKYASKRYNISFLQDMRNYIADHVQKMPIYSLKKYSSGDIVSRVNNDLSIVSNFYNSLPSLIFQPLLMCIGILYMLSISWKLTLATIFIVPVSSVLFDKLNKPIQVYSKEVMEQSSIINILLQDTIRGIEVLKAFNIQQVLLERFKTVTFNIKNKGLNIGKLNAYRTPVFLALRLIPQLVYPLYGGYLAMNKEITLGNLFAYGVLISYVFGPMETILGFVSQIRESNPAFKRIVELLEENIEGNKGEKVDIKDDLPLIEFNNISFSYGDENKILNDISFSINKGSMTALVGSSGSGKSTILKLICGFFKPDSGKINISGREIDECNMQSLRSQISYMSQESYLYPGTIAENILTGNPKASMEEIISAAKAANAHEFIKAMPEGYSTYVGEKGGMLSGGQRQRIALARMILKDTPILLLDEPTASLDTKSEALIQEALQKLVKHKTVLVVAHRLNTIKDADQIIVFEKGNIKEIGNHEELIRSNGLYSKLYNNQSIKLGEEISA